MIQLNEVTVVADDGRAILDRVSLRVEPGEFVVITGPSGSGKSTLLRAIVGLARIERGSVEVNNEVLSSHSVFDIRRSIAYVDQEPVLGTDQTTVGEALRRPFQWRANRHAPPPNDESVQSSLKDVGLTNGILTQSLAVVSGGEKQRLALVRAHLLDRPILLADEPTSALDSKHRRLVAQYLREMTDTALVVSHDREVVNQATRVLLLKNGQLTESSANEINAELEAVGEERDIPAADGDESHG